MAIVLDGTNGITTETGTGDVSVGDDLIFTGTGNRITGDFSNATAANRVAFQSSTVNGNTSIAALPNGTATGSIFVTFNNQDPANANPMQIRSLATEAGLFLGANGTAVAIPMTFHNGGSERVRIDTSGNVGIGTSSPISGGLLTVGSGSGATSAIQYLNAGSAGSCLIGRVSGSNAWLVGDLSQAIGSGTGLINYVYGANPWLVYTNNTERARIDSSGNLLVGKTATSVTVSGAVIAASGAVGSSIATGNDTFFVYNTTAATYRFYVTDAGTVFATNTTISAISDQRLKENIQDIDVGLDAVMALKPRKFDWKEGKGKDIKGDRGWIAQEFEQVFPDMIDEWRDPSPSGEEPYKSVRADLIPVLVKAMQEQQAIIEQLKTRLDAANL
jgi:hypothetical protein